MIELVISALVGLVVAGAVYYSWSYVENLDAREKVRQDAENADEP
jgi:hypothetical protein